VMQANGIRADQVSQVRGFADQRLRQGDHPLDPSNRRISLIVQYILKNNKTDEENPSDKNPAAEQKKEATGEQAPDASAEKSPEKPSEH
jgi:chemotaxis protein MotB